MKLINKIFTLPVKIYRKYKLKKIKKLRKTKQKKHPLEDYNYPLW